MSDSVQPHGQQPTRLLHPQDSPGKSTGVGCHFLLHVTLHCIYSILGNFSCSQMRGLCSRLSLEKRNLWLALWKQRQEKAWSLKQTKSKYWQLELSKERKGEKAMYDGAWVSIFLVVVFVQLLIMSNSLRPHGLQHDRFPCPLLSPGVCSNSCLLSQWCHPTISSSVTHFSSCPQSSLESGSFPVSQLLVSDGQSIGTSALASILPVNIQGWFPSGLTGLISLLSTALLRIVSSTTIWKYQFLTTQPSLLSIHCYWKTHTFD